MVPTSSNACYEQNDTLCAWVYDRTGSNETLANLTDWFVDRPLRIGLILLAAWILSWLARRWVKRLVTRLVTPPSSPTAGLGRLGIEIPDIAPAAGRDPRRAARANSISVVLTSSLVVTIWVIALLLVLGQVGVDLGPLLAGAGIAGVALGFGAQSLVKDCIAGLFMLIEDQYGIGDVVDLGEATGVVEEITLRVTVLRSLDGTVWHVPNGVVQRVGNKSQIWSVALVDVDVAYDTDLGRARELLHRAADEVCLRDEHADEVLEDPEVLGVETLGADGVTLRLTVKVTPGTQWALQRALREHVKAVYDREGIEIPFPQRTVWVKADPDVDANRPGNDAERPTDEPADPATTAATDPPAGPPAGDDTGS